MTKAGSLPCHFTPWLACGTLKLKGSDQIRMPQTILVVDDDSQMRGLCRAALEQAGYFVMEAGDGKQALAETQEAAVDLILLDLCMPDMDGLEFLETVRVESPGLKIVTMSGFMGGVLLPAAKHLGGTAALIKPFSPDSLVSLVGELLAEGGPGGASE